MGVGKLIDKYFGKCRAFLCATHILLPIYPKE